MNDLSPEVRPPEPKVSKNSVTQQRIEVQEAYLRKKHPDYNPVQLRHHARDRVVARMMLEKKAQENAKLRELSETDPLTGLPNLRSFEKQIKAEANRMKRRKTKSTLITLDINGLKEINDTLGHQAGDQLLINTANALKMGSRISDLIFIFRGEKSDEFRVMLPETDLEETEVWWERVSLLFNQEGIKISAGAAEIEPEDIEKSIEESDRAMYCAKLISKQTGSNLMLRSDQIKTQ